MQQHIGPLCSLPGRPDVYGVGIRTGFYIQWLGTLILEYFSEAHIDDMRFLGGFFSAAASTALVIGVAHADIQPMDAHLLLLLAMGFFFFNMPLHVWRVLTGCNPRMDPFILTKETHGLFYHVTTVTMLATNAAIGTWFYTNLLPRLDRECRDVVFMFAKVDLENKKYMVAGAIFCIGILVIITGYIFLGSCCVFSPPRAAQCRQPSKSHFRNFRIVRLLSGFVVFTLLVAAIELPIKWNKIQNVSEFANLAQLIPFFVSIGLFLRSCAEFMHHDKEDDEDDVEEQNENEYEYGSESDYNMSSTAQDVHYREQMNQAAQYQHGQDYYHNGREHGHEDFPQWPPVVHYSRWRLPT